MRVCERDDGGQAEGAAEDGEGAGMEPDGAEVPLGRDDGELGVALCVLGELYVRCSPPWPRVRTLMRPFNPIEMETFWFVMANPLPIVASERPRGSYVAL